MLRLCPRPQSDPLAWDPPVPAAEKQASQSDKAILNFLDNMQALHGPKSVVYISFVTITSALERSSGPPSDPISWMILLPHSSNHVPHSWSPLHLLMVKWRMKSRQKSKLRA